MPKQVRLAAWIVVCTLLLDSALMPLWTVISEAARTVGNPWGSVLMFSWLYIFMVVVPVMLMAWLMFAKLRAGRNWARVLLAIIAALMTVYPLLLIASAITSGTFSPLPGILAVALMKLIPPGLMLFATVLVYSPAAKVWFRRNQPS